MEHRAKLTQLPEAVSEDVLTPYGSMAPGLSIRFAMNLETISNSARSHGFERSHFHAPTFRFFEVRQTHCMCKGTMSRQICPRHCSQGRWTSAARKHPWTLLTSTRYEPDQPNLAEVTVEIRRKRDRAAAGFREPLCGGGRASCLASGNGDSREHFVSRHRQDTRRNKRRARWSGSSRKLVLQHVRWVSQNCTSRFKATNGGSCAVEGSPGTMQMKS